MSMKKKNLFIAVLLLLVTILISSCGFEKKDFSNNYNPETDSNYTYIPQGERAAIAETKDGYYFLAGSYLYYVDKNSRKPVILCNKPNCLHNNETDQEKTLNCNAFFIGINISVAYNNSHSYVSSNQITAEGTTACLYELSPDGTKRKIITDFGKFEPTSIVFHRGYAYYVSASYNTSGTSIYAVKRVSINKVKAKPENLYEGTLDNGNIQDLLCYGNNLYFKEYGKKAGENVENYIRIDLQTKKANQFLAGSNDSEEYISKIDIFNNRLNYTISNVDKMGVVFGIKNFTSDLEGKDIKPGFELSAKEVKFTDEKYIYTYTGPWLSLEKGEKYVLSVYDQQGKVIDTMDTSFLSTNGKIVGGGQQDLFLLNYADNKYQILTVNKALIGTGKMKPELLFEVDTEKMTNGVLITPK